MVNESVYIYGLTLCIFCWIVGCDKQAGPEMTAGVRQQQFVVKAAPDNRVDSARLFFFRTQGNTDTLITERSIYGVEYLKPKDFYLTLPAGKYKTYVFANVPARHLIITSPYSSKLLRVNYSHGEQPGAVYYGYMNLNVGVDTLNMSSLVLFSSAIDLSIRKVPENVRKIVVTLLNTSAGYAFSRGYSTEVTDPPITETLNDVQQDSTYQVMLTCFPGPPQHMESILQVEGYDAGQRLIYSGQSAPFLARYGQNMVLSCSFEALSKTSTPVKQEVRKVCFKVKEE